MSPAMAKSEAIAASNSERSLDNQHRLPTIKFVFNHPPLRHGCCVSAWVFTIGENGECLLDTMDLLSPASHDCDPLASQWLDIASPESGSVSKVSPARDLARRWEKYRADRGRSQRFNTCGAVTSTRIRCRYHLRHQQDPEPSRRISLRARLHVSFQPDGMAPDSRPRPYHLGGPLQCAT